jgi:ABC-type nitrate/sulfonate/bicarbonate transport system substrate-binding protein
LANAAQAQALDQVDFMSSNDKSCAFYPQIVSDEMGFFSEEGVRINLLSTDTRIPYVAFLANGDADLVTLDAAEVLQAVEAGQPIKVVYEACQAVSDFIVVPSESPIDDVKELKGKAIGVARDSDLTLAALALFSAGLALNDIATVVVGPSGPALAQSLRDQTISAFIGTSSDQLGIEAAGLMTRNIAPSELSKNPCNSIVAWGPTLEKKRDLIVRFLRGWAKGHHAGVLDTGAVMAACRKRIPEQWEKPAAGEFLINRHVYQTQLRRTMDYGEMQPDLWADIQPAYLAVKAINALHDPSSFLEMSVTAEVNRFTTDDVKAGIRRFREQNKEIPTPKAGPSPD